MPRERQVIGIDLEGHGRTALRATPMSHERNGDDVAAVLRHLKIAKADVGGYSHGGDAAIRMTIQHPEMVRNLDQPTSNATQFTPSVSRIDS